MRKPMRPIVTLLLLFGGIHCLTGATGDLVSIKKGGSDGKAWAVLYFEESVPWIGVSQPEVEKLSLYFQSRSGDYRGSLIPVDPFSLYFQQLRETPPICRMDILYEGDVPVAILRKGNLLVLSLNDPRISMDLSENGSEWREENLRHLTRVTSRGEGERNLTTLLFDRGAELGGFIRFNRDNPKLLLKNVKNDMAESEFWFQDGDLSNLIVQADPATQLVSQIHLNFEAGAPYSIARRDNEWAIETSIAHRQLFTQAEAVVAVSDDLGTRITVTDDPPRKSETPRLTDTSAQAVSPPPVRFTQGQPEQTDEELLAAQALMGDPETVEPMLSGGHHWIEPDPRPARVKPEPGTAGDDTAETRQEPPRVRTLKRIESELIPWDDQVTFDFRKTPLIDALRTIAVTYDLNMVIAEGVEGQVSLNLKNITLRRALDNIIHLNNCMYTVEDDIITVKPVRAVFKGGMVTRIYRLKYADAQNLKNVIGKIASNDTMVQVFHPEFLNFDQAGKFRREYNQVAVQGIRRASILIVTDTFDKIEEIDQVIHELDRAPAQILIRSKLVEMSPEYSRNLGIDWERSLSLMQQLSRPGGVKEQTLSIASSGQTAQPLDVHSTISLGQITQGQYSAVIDFLREKTDSKLISNPSLLAMDNEEASISVGTTVPIPQIQRGAGGTGDMVTFQYKEVNIQLNVSPHISRNGEIIMFINPVIEEITGWVEMGQSRAPITAKRSVNSIVTVQDGATLVVGGLIKTQRVRTVKKLWLLGSIPLIGPLFQHERYEDRETNLLIFITPTIIAT